MLEKSNRWFAGFALFCLGGLMILFPLMFLAASSHPSLLGNITGLLIGTVLGGPVVAGGITLMYGRSRYASYAFLFAGIEYGALELYLGIASGVPLLLILGMAFLAVGLAIHYWSRSHGSENSGESNDNLTAIGIVLLGLGILAAILASGSANTNTIAYLTSLSILLFGSIVILIARILARRHSSDEPA